MRSAAGSQTFDFELELQLLKSEKQRVTLMAVLFGVSLVSFTVHMALAGDSVPADKRNVLFVPPVIFLCGTIFELVLRKIIAVRIERRAPLPESLRYVNLLLEVSIPSVLILVFSLGLDNFFLALSSPASYVYFLFIFLSVLRLEFRICFVAGLAAALEYAGLIQLGQWLAPESFPPEIRAVPGYMYARCAVLLAAGGITGLVALQLRRRAEDTLAIVQERNEILDTFGKHVSPEVAARLLEQEHEVESREVAVLFLDIRDFTSFSEGRSPVEVIGRLNEAFAFMIDVVNRHHGIINKFLGDGFMAVFGAPLSMEDNAGNAIRAATDIVEEMERRNTAFSDDPFHVGIGIHYGEAVTGTVGSPTRKEYTIIGDVVNLASRIEALNKKFSSQILISAAVLESAGLKAADYEAMPPVRVKGRQELIESYRVR